MRLMTFNLRFANPADGPNIWEHRQTLVVDLIIRYVPDLLGTQEGTVPQLDYLSRELAGYLPLTGHRQVDPTCQYPTIFYRQERFQARDSGEFWLSQTPQTHRSKSWDSAFPRMVTYGLFRETGRDSWFYFLNTHLDHISAQARWHGARLIREHFFECPEPLILVGDFNEPPDSPVYNQLLGGGSRLRDTWRVLNPGGADPTTQHNFDGRPRGARIDWILASPPFRVKEAKIITDHQNGRYPSDHFPYLAEVDY